MTAPAPGVVRVRPGVQFTTIAPAGFAILGALVYVAQVTHLDLTITSACDGQHSGPGDPHVRGEAYDVRTHDWTETVKDAVCYHLIDALRGQDDPPAVPNPDVARSFQTTRWFACIEAAGTSNEHLHVQLRRGRVYP